MDLVGVLTQSDKKHPAGDHSFVLPSPSLSPDPSPSSYSLAISPCVHISGSIVGLVLGRLILNRTN